MKYYDENNETALFEFMKKKLLAKYVIIKDNNGEILIR